MANADIVERLQNALYKVRANLAKVRNGRTSMSEEATKAAFIAPLLEGLGWDTSDPFEVRPEYKGDPKGNPVDYALLDDGRPLMFIEAKALDINLDDVKWQSQVAAYAAVAGVQWCLLTDGDVYSVYNLFAPGGITHKLFRTVTISDEGSAEETLDVLNLLAKEVFPEQIDQRWQTGRVDQRVEEALRDMFAERDTRLINAIKARVKDLKPAEIRRALERADIAVAFTRAEPVPDRDSQPPDEEAIEWGVRSYRGPLRLEGQTVVLHKWRYFHKELREERVSVAHIRKTAEAALAIQGKGRLVSNPDIRDHQEGPHSWSPTQRALAVLYLTGSLELVPEGGQAQRFRLAQGMTVDMMLQRIAEQAQPATAASDVRSFEQVFDWDADIAPDGRFTLNCSYRPEPTKSFSVAGVRVPPTGDFKPARRMLLDEVFRHIEPLFPDLAKNRVRAKAWSGVHRVYPSKVYGGK